MNIPMQRLQARSIYWRSYAAIVVLLLLIMVQRRPLIPGAGLNFEGAQAFYWSLAPIGLIGYAYGFRIGSQTFWRVYALVFTADITVRAMAKVGWVPLARMFGFPEDSRHGTTTILLGLAFIAATCVALLRYGGWLKAQTEALPSGRSAPTASSPLAVDRQLPVSRPYQRKTLPAQDTRISSFASTVAAWAAIIFVFPAALFAARLLVPQASELFDRILHHPAAPLLSLTVILALQVALVVLPTLTFLSWLKDRAEAKPGRRRRVKTTTLAWVTIGVGLSAYVWFAGMVAAFPD